MTAPRFRYEPLAPGQPVCTGCWQVPAVVCVWEGQHWVEALCAACTETHRREHQAGQRELWEEDAP